MDPLTPRLFRGTIKLVVEVFASTYDEARELIENGDSSVTITAERDGDYEIVELVEIKQ